MNTRKTKKQSRIKSYDVATDECGYHTDFKVPRAAMWYDHDVISLKDQDKIDDCMDRLIELHYSINEN